MAKEEVKSWWKEHIVQFITLGFTVGSLVFSMGMFYSRFNDLEKNVESKLVNQEKIVKVVAVEQGSRLQNLENMVMLHMNSVNNGVKDVKAEILKNRKVSQINKLEQTVELRASNRVLYDTVVKLAREIRDTTKNSGTK